MKKQSLTCIQCPLGCRILVIQKDKKNHYSGHECQKGIEYAQNEHRKLLEEKGESGFALSPLDIKLKMEGCWDSVYVKVYTDCIKESDEDYNDRIKKEEEKCEKEWQKYLVAKTKYEKELEKELKRLKK